MRSRLGAGVLFGGRSSEHDVSISSARSVLAALSPDRYEVVPVAISREGLWYTGPDALERLQEGRLETLQRVSLLPEPGIGGLVPIQSGAPRTDRVIPLDVILPILHGPYGEDGTVQGLFELAGIPYVGAGVAGSAVGLDKSLAKAVFAARGLPQLEYRALLRSEFDANPSSCARRMVDEIGLPAFVKPSSAGSSVGVSRVDEPEEMLEALQEAARWDRKILVERASTGREIECSVLGNDEPVASCPGEIFPAGEFYDYRSKYLDTGSVTQAPAELTPELADRIRHLACAAFVAIEACGMARVDFFVEPPDVVYINEVNTIPGFTPISMYPKLWEVSGLPYPELLDRLIQLAVQMHADRQRSSVDFAPPAG